MKEEHVLKLIDAARIGLKHMVHDWDTRCGEEMPVVEEEIREVKALLTQAGVGYEYSPEDLEP